MNLALIPGLGSVGPTELIILLTIILLLFGAKRIPELAKGLGSGVREFKKGTSGKGEPDELKDEKEKKGEELPGAVGEDTRKARVNEEPARDERASERPGEPVGERTGERAEDAEQGAKRAEQNL
ncbi:MAG: twin-arginine translocase TatA/TatE family subunit [Rubrobacteraceae bacterium]